MALRKLISEVRWIVEKDANSPYQDAEQTSAVAMAHSMHGDENHPDFHPKGIAAHTTAMKHLAGALNQARQSNDIDNEKQLKGRYVRHHDAREAHRAAHVTHAMPPQAAESNRRS